MGLSPNDDPSSPVLSPEKEAGRTSWAWAAWAACVALFLLAGVLWLALDHRPQRWDESIHLSTALHFSDVLKDHPLRLPAETVGFDGYYPPLVPIVGGVFALGSRTEDAMTYAVFAFVLLGAWSLFAVARRRLGPEAAVGATGVFLFSPLFFNEAHSFMLDVPLTCVTVAAFDALDRSGSFRRRGASLAFGALLGAGMLVKWMAPVFLVVPVLYACGGFRSLDDGARERRKNLGLALGVALLVAGPWYLWNAPGLAVGFYLNAIKKGAVEGQAAWWTPEALTFYPKVLLQALHPWGIVALAAGAWGVLRRKAPAFWLWALVAPVVFFALIPNHKDRYVMPVLPFAALLASAWIVSLGSRARRWAAGALVLAMALPVAVLFSRSGVPSPERPDPADWKIGALLSHVPPGREVVLAVIPDHPYLNEFNVSFLARTKFPWVRTRSLYDFPMFADYALLRTGDQGPKYEGADVARTRLTAALLDPASPEGKLFERVASEPLPDGSTAYLMRRRADLKVGGEALRKAVLREMGRYVRDPVGLRLSVVPEKDGGETLSVGFQEGLVGDFAHKPAGLRMRGVSLTVRGLVVNPASLSSGRLQVLTLRGVELASAEVRREDLRAFAAPFAKGIEDLEVDLRDGKVEVTGRAHGIPIRLEVALSNPSAEDSNVYFRVEKVKAGFVTVPSFLVNFLLKDRNPLLRKQTAPFQAAFGPIRIEEGMLRIGSDKGPGD